jgi:hypothetical protein
MDEPSAVIPEEIRAMFQPASVTGDVWTLLSRYSEPDERAAGRQRLATGKHLSPYFADPHVRREIGRRFCARRCSHETRRWLERGSRMVAAACVFHEGTSNEQLQI